MPTYIATQPDYVQAVAELVTKMSVERAAQLYDFARFLQMQDSSDDAWLNDTEEHMQIEDALWKETFTRHSDKFAALANAAQAEIEAGKTQPMFDEQGKFTVDKLTNNA